MLRRPANRPDAQLLASLLSRATEWADRIGDGRLSFGKVGLPVELSWNTSRTRVGVAEISAGRVAWARNAEAMSRLGNDSDC